MQEELFLFDNLPQFSMSHLEDYLRCPRYYELIYIKKKRFQIVSDKLSYGTMLHKLISDYLSLPPEREFNNLKNQFEQKIWLKMWRENEDSFDLYLKNLLNFHEQFKMVRTVAVETGRKIVFDNSVINGRIDCIIKDLERDKYILIDFKQSMSDFFKNENNQQYKNLQLILYLLIAREKFKDIIDLDNLKGAYYYFDINFMEEIDFSPSVVEDGIRIIKELINEILTQTTFPAQICHYCSDCGYKNYCDVGRFIV